MSKGRSGQKYQEKGKLRHNITTYDTDHLSLIIQNIPEQKYFADIKHVTVAADSLDLSDSVTEYFSSLFIAKIIHATKRRILLYIPVHLLVAKCCDLYVMNVK